MIHERFAQLRSAYPDDIQRIEEEERIVSELLKQQEYYELPETQRLIVLCRKDIVDARIKLATNRGLNQEQRDALWMFIESREWFVKMVSKNFTDELERIDRELEAELQR